MAKELLNGRLVVLRGLTEADRPQLTNWKNDPELKRLTGPGAFVPIKPEDIKIEDSDDTIQFAICLTESLILIGWIALTHISWNNRCAELSIYIGESKHQGESYGSDAIHVLLDYAFNELNLHRVELEVVGYNLRAIKTYEKIGFVHEGRKREYGERDGKRYDMEQYGLLSKEFRRQSSECPGQG